MPKVFVYGTLKRHHGNSYYLDNSKLIKQAYVPGYLLINTHGFPYAIEAKLTDFVIGEVYKVDDKTMEELDHLEGYPDHYQRRKINAYSLDTMILGGKKRAEEAWIYYLEEDNFNLAERFGTTHEWGAKIIQPEQTSYQSFTEGGTTTCA